MRHWVIWNVPGSVKATTIESLFESPGDRHGVKYVDRMLGMRKVIVRTRNASAIPAVPAEFALKYNTKIKRYTCKPKPVRFSTDTVIVHCVRLGHKNAKAFPVIDALQCLCSVRFPIHKAVSVSVNPDATTIQRGGVSDEQREYLYHVYVQMDTLKDAEDLLSWSDREETPSFDAEYCPHTGYFSHVLQLSTKSLRRGRQYRPWIVPQALKEGHTSFVEEISAFRDNCRRHTNQMRKMSPVMGPAVPAWQPNPDAPVFVPREAGVRQEAASQFYGGLSGSSLDSGSSALQPFSLSPSGVSDYGGAIRDVDWSTTPTASQAGALLNSPDSTEDDEDDDDLLDLASLVRGGNAPEEVDAEALGGGHDYANPQGCVGWGAALHKYRPSQEGCAEEHLPEHRYSPSPVELRDWPVLQAHPITTL